MHRPARHAPTDAERPQITLADSIDFLACDGNNNSCSSSRRIWPTYNVVVPDILTIPGHPPPGHLSPVSGKLYYHRHSPRLGQGNYSDPIAKRNGLSVCIPVREHISETTRPIFASNVHATFGCGSTVLFWRHWDTLCTCRFMDDVIFVHIYTVSQKKTRH